MSQDPVTQAPFSTQGLNRYSYVFNNPINATDPSGFESDWAYAGFFTLAAADAGLLYALTSHASTASTAATAASTTADVGAGAGVTFGQVVNNASTTTSAISLGIVTVDWKNSAVRISLKLCTKEAASLVLVMFGFTNVRLPRLEPWGPSSSVNEAHLTQIAPAIVNLVIQLQSGDVLTIDAKSIDLLRPNGSVDASRVDT